MISEYEENVLNWSEHLFNPHYLPPTRINEKNAAFGIYYGQGSQPIASLDPATIIRTGRQAGRTLTSWLNLQRLFQGLVRQPAPPPPLNPRQERARRNFLRGP